MRECTTPLLVDPAIHRNATDLVMQRLQVAPDHVAFEARSGAVTDPWRQVTTSEFVAEVRALAKGLMAQGVHPRDSVAIMSPTRFEWALAEMAAWFAGAIVVPIYETSAPEQVAGIVRDANVRFAFAGEPSHAQMVRQAFAEVFGVSDSADSGGGKVWTLAAAPLAPDHGSTGGHKATATLDDLKRAGADIADSDLEARRTLATLDSTATIVYTSGTTAAPKGALITHRNFVGQVLNVAAAYTDVVRESGNTIIFLPMAHVLARGLQLTCLASGMRIAHLSDPRDVVPSLAVLRPTFLVVVPRVLQKIQASAGAAAAQKRLGRVWSLAQDTAIAWGRLAERRDVHLDATTPLGLRLRHAVFDRLFYGRLRALVGGRLDYLLSGAAALDAELSLFFRGIGLPVIEGYGLTETTAPLTGNLPGSIASGSVGRPIPGSTVRISDDGEVLARGVGVFAGYHRAADNEGAFVDGFFRTGDLGMLDDHGNLTLRGRLKDVIVTAGGKTITPAIWEGYVDAEPLIAHAVMVGDERPYPAALILLDPDALVAWARREGLEDVAQLEPPAEGAALELNHPRVRAVVGAAIDAANARVARSEQVRRFTVLLTDVSDANPHVTPTLKLKRARFIESCASRIDDLYS